MTSLFDLNNSTDSENDCDYEPSAGELSSDEEELLPSIDGEIEAKRVSGKRQNVLELENSSIGEHKLVSNIVDEKKKADDAYKNFLDEAAAEMKDVKNVLCECVSSVNDRTVKPVDTDASCTSDSKIEKTVLLSVPAIKRKGLESVLGSKILSLNKKQKVTTLTKSISDWKNFKKEEGIEEELASYNRGKCGFLEKRRFLERSDVQNFKIERDMRLTKRERDKRK